MSLHALLRPWWKRFVFGQPHVGFEIVGRPRRSTSRCGCPATCRLAWWSGRWRLRFPAHGPRSRRTRSATARRTPAIWRRASSDSRSPRGSPSAEAATSLWGRARGADRSRRGRARSCRSSRGPSRPGRGTGFSARRESFEWEEDRAGARGASGGGERAADRRRIPRRGGRPRDPGEGGVAAVGLHDPGRGHRLASRRGGASTGSPERSPSSRAETVFAGAVPAAWSVDPDQAHGSPPHALGSRAGADRDRSRRRSGGRSRPRAGAKTVAPSRTLSQSGRVLGLADHPGVRRPVAIAEEDARHHLHVVGETGTGKSTLLANLVLQDAAAGRAAVVIDPKETWSSRSSSGFRRL